MDELNNLVRRVDQDRWLAAQFADADARARLIVLYAVSHEIARVGESVREPAIGEIRLAWWRDALGEVGEGRPPRTHPALAALARAGLGSRTALDLREITLARSADLYAAPFARWSDLECYVDATAGALMRLAMDVCVPGLDAAAFAQRAGRAWGLAGLARADAFWRARGRSVFPRDSVGAEDARRHAKAASTEARDLALALPPSAFPAYGYVALVPAYVRADLRGGPSLLGRKARLILASATGRL